MSDPFDPRNGTFGNWPQNQSKPTISLGSTGDAVRYLEGVLYWCCGATAIYVDPVGTYCLFTNQDKTYVQNFQTFWGITADGIVGPQTWGYLDYVVYLNGRQ